MIRLTQSFITTLCLGLATTLCAAAPGWRLVWEDDFDSLDEEKWVRVESYDPTNRSLHAYLPEQVSVADGKLHILAEDEPAEWLSCRSGQVISTDSQRYGRWEVHAKMPTTTGMWPAIWLLPDVRDHKWPSGGEIDIMEGRGNKPRVTSSAFHYGTNPPYEHKFVYHEQMTRNGDQFIDYSKDYHTYAVDWTANYLRFYVDGVNYYTVYDEDVEGFLSQDTKPMKLMINNAIGGHFLPNPDDSTVWPQTMSIDWVRVYEASTDTEPIQFVNPGFEENGGSLAGWTLFGNEIVDVQNISSSSEMALEGARSLKLFGAFVEGSESYSGVSQGITVAAGDQVEAKLSARVQSADSLAGTDNSVVMKVEFFRVHGAKFGSSEMISEEVLVIADGDAQQDAWAPHSISATAPEGAVEARLTIVFVQPKMAAGSIYIDQVDFSIN